MPYHLPVLLNPLVNAVFNCPNPSTSNLKKLFSKLKDQRFILLVPPCEKLLDCNDKLSGSSLQELCYNYDFVASHVLLIDEQSDEYMTAAPPSQVKYDTFNRKKVIVRSQNRVILTSDGFQFKKRCHITNVDLFVNFNEYLLQDYRFPILYIDEPVCAESVRAQQVPPRPDIGSDTSEGERSLPATMPPQRNKTSFENILRIHPDWTRRFNQLFGEYRSAPVGDGPHPELFHDIVRRAYSAMKSEALFRTMPDLPDLIYDYVELNLYDDIWVRITHHFRDSEFEMVGLRYLSLDQLETDLYPKKYQNFSLKKVVSIENNIELAVNSFSRLPLSHAHADKATTLIETLRSLSKADNSFDGIDSSPIAIDADTLLSLFVLVVCRTQLRSLKGQLFYLQNFAKNESSIRFGVLGYAISTLEAVVCYFDELKGSSKMARLEADCAAARTLVDTLSSEASSLNLLQYQITKKTLRYRTEQGESLLSLCITNSKNDILRALLSKERDFPLEDLLEDSTTDGCTLLMQALKCGNGDAAILIVDLLKFSCTEQEMRAYFNKSDKDKRTAAHYLTHEVGIIKEIGKLFDWDAKDSSGHTALFTIFRSYDQPNYDEVIIASFSCAVEWYRLRGESFCFTDHEDRKENTLLHILKRSISILLEYDSVDVNATNKKGLTPLMVYAKYNRLDNIKAIANDKRVILGKIQPTLLLGAMDYAKNPLILHKLAERFATETVFGKCYVHTLKFEASSWLLKITFRNDDEEDFKTVEIHLKTVQNFFRTLLRTCPMTFMPLDSPLDQLANLARARVSGIGKIETMCFLRNLTNCFNALLNGRDLPLDILADESKLLSSIKAQYKAYKNGGTRLSNKRVEPEEMNIIQGFLRFNQTEVSALRSKLHVLKKLAIFLRLKSSDVEQSNKLLFSFEYEGIENLMPLMSRKNSCTVAYGNNAMIQLVEDVDFMLKSTLRLQNHINDLLQAKIPGWWKLYGELLSLHKQFAQHFPHLVKSDEPAADSGIIGKLIESKKEKLEKRLSFEIAETRRSMNQAGASIAHDHESLAEQLSKFMEFKGEFLCRGVVKRWVKENIKEMKEKLIHIQRDLRDLSR